MNIFQRTGFRSQQESQVKSLTHVGEETITCQECLNVIETKNMELDAPYLTYDDGVNLNEENSELGYLVKLNILCPNCGVFIENGFLSADKVYFEE